MREIKFRGIRLDNNEWVVGSLALLGKQSGIWGTDIIYGQAIIDRVDAETVGQYTGLKDKNGVEIYEGDIVQQFGGHLFKVLFKDGAFFYNRIKFEGADWLVCNIKNVEVIGNIHQNPGLLTKEE